MVRDRLFESATTELASLKWHTVKKGETVTTIARKLGVNRTDLAEANYLRTSSRLSIGQKLIVPQEATVLMAARTSRQAPVTESRSIVAATAVVPATPDNGDRVKVVYRVKRGDTLASIARVFKTTISALQTWNGLPGSRIQAGQRLTIYTARTN
jgi:membrane-bound lytic murein transglycosylase D